MASSPPLTADPHETIAVPAGIADLQTFRRWTWSDAFPERGRISYLDGEITWDVSPQEIDSHARVKQAICRDLGLFLGARELGELLPAPTRFVNEAAGLSDEPDALVCSWESVEAGRIVFHEIAERGGEQLEVVGSPDVVVEVVSRSSVRKDTILRPPLYFAAGVREFWLVDARGEEIAFDVFARGDACFEPVEPDADDFRRSAVLDASFWLGRTRNRLGISRYELRSRT